MLGAMLGLCDLMATSWGRRELLGATWAPPAEFCSCCGRLVAAWEVWPLYWGLWAGVGPPWGRWAGGGGTLWALCDRAAELGNP